MGLWPDPIWDHLWQNELPHTKEPESIHVCVRLACLCTCKYLLWKTNLILTDAFRQKSMFIKRYKVTFGRYCMSHQSFASRPFHTPAATWWRVWNAAWLTVFHLGEVFLFPSLVYCNQLHSDQILSSILPLNLRRGSWSVWTIWYDTIIGLFIFHKSLRQRVSIYYSPVLHFTLFKPVIYRHHAASDGNSETRDLRIKRFQNTPFTRIIFWCYWLFLSVEFTVIAH